MKIHASGEDYLELHLTTKLLLISESVLTILKAAF